MDTQSRFHSYKSGTNGRVDAPARHTADVPDVHNDAVFVHFPFGAIQWKVVIERDAKFEGRASVRQGCHGGRYLGHHAVGDSPILDEVILGPRKLRILYLVINEESEVQKAAVDLKKLKDDKSRNCS